MRIWQLIYRDITYNIVEQDENEFAIEHTDPLNKFSDMLWFPSYQSARKYLREESYVKGRFKRIK